MGTADTTAADYATVKTRVDGLKALVDSFLDTVQPSLARLGQAQDAVRWTALPECAGFRNQYGVSISAAEANLRAVWDDIAAFAHNLKAATDTMSSLDDDVRQDLQDILARLDAGTQAGYGLTPDNTTLTTTGSGTATGDVNAVGQSGV